MASWISTYIMTAAKQNVKTNADYINQYAIHHIVPKGLVEAIPSVLVLKAVGIKLHASNYKAAYYNPDVESFNLIRIKRKTHIAIHSCNTMYCGWVNAMIVPSYLATFSKGRDMSKLVVSNVLMAMGNEILAVDSMII